MKACAAWICPCSCRDAELGGSYFGALRDHDGKIFCSPCMDDLEVLSKTLKEHIEQMEVVLACHSRRFRVQSDEGTIESAGEQVLELHM